MTGLKVLSTVAAAALALAIMAPAESFAQSFNRKGGGIRAHGGFNAGASRGGGPAVRFGNGGNFRGGHRGGFVPGIVAGAIIGGAIASQGYGYGSGYYAPRYYDDQYYDDGAVAAPIQADDSATYCMQTYRSYDPRSGTYLSNDGYRYPCP